MSSLTRMQIGLKIPQRSPRKDRFGYIFIGVLLSEKNSNRYRIKFIISYTYIAIRQDIRCLNYVPKTCYRKN